jgi:hypothetical protein
MFGKGAAPQKCCCVWSPDRDLYKVVNEVILKKLSLKKRPHQDEIIERAYRFGQNSPQRPIMIRFKKESDKERVLKQAPSLRGTKISISDDLTTEERQVRRKIVEAHKAARAENIESKVLRQGLLMNGEIVPSAKLEKSDWLEKFLQKPDNVPLALANESSPPVTPTLPRKNCPNLPSKKPNKK